MTIYSTIFGSSAEAFPQILLIHVKLGALILDCTYRKGVFWKRMNGEYDVIRSDLAELPGLDLRADLRELPFRNQSVDCMVLDPPYGNGSSNPRTDCISGSYDLPSCRTPEGIRKLYRSGLDEASRILRIKGILIVKCQSLVNGGRQHWIAEEIWREAELNGFEAIDRFLVVPKGMPILRHPDRPQQHARKWGSTFWVFKKEKE